MGNKQKQQPKHKFGRRDVRIAIATTGLCLLIGLGSTIGWHWFARHMRNQRDATLPLEINNLAYCNGEKLDLLVPQGDTPRPVVVYVHGGGWRYGSKVGGSISTFRSLTKEGFAVASINYRLSSSANRFPVQVQDVLCAVRFLRAHASLFNLRADRIALVGNSAGGHLAALAATASDNADWTIGAYHEQSSRVQAVVSMGGHLDLGADNFTPVTRANIERLLGTDADRSAASPLTYLSPDDPPLLVIHGKKDRLVPLSQATAFTEAAQAKGIPVQYLSVTNANHNLRAAYGPFTPVSDEWVRTMRLFLHEQLDQ